MFNVGDKVIISKDLKEIDRELDVECIPSVVVVSNMIKYEGKVATITEILHDYPRRGRYGKVYKLDIDGGMWNWTADYFDKYEDNFDVATSDEVLEFLI